MFSVKQVSTFTATIWVGLLSGPLGTQRTEYSVEDAQALARQYCDAVGLCVTITPTTYVYKGGEEPGIAVGMINYPRFPSDAGTIKKHAFALAELLRTGLGQFKVSIVFPDETVLLGEDKH